MDLAARAETRPFISICLAYALNCGLWISPRRWEFLAICRCLLSRDLFGSAKCYSKFTEFIYANEVPFMTPRDEMRMRSFMTMMMRNARQRQRERETAAGQRIDWDWNWLTTGKRDRTVQKETRLGE